MHVSNLNFVRLCVMVIARIVIPLDISAQLCQKWIFFQNVKFYMIRGIYSLSLWTYSRRYCTRIIAMTPWPNVGWNHGFDADTFFSFHCIPSPNSSSLTYQQPSETKNTSHRSSSILNSVKWIIIDEGMVSWSCPYNMWTQLIHGMKWPDPLRMVSDLLKIKITGAHCTLN